MSIKRSLPSFSGLVLVLVAFIASPSGGNISAIGAVDCNSKEFMKKLNCLTPSGVLCNNNQSYTYDKCNMGSGYKNKLCDEDVVEVCRSNASCQGNLFSDKFVTTVTCSPKY
jgi:hypothetical protein